jgi:hypothetical protein
MAISIFLKEKRTRSYIVTVISVTDWTVNFSLLWYERPRNAILATLPTNE